MKINRKNIAESKYLNEDGTFEAFPYSYSIGTTSTGNNTMTINYRIREDVPQPHQGEIVDYADRYNDSEIGEKYINTLIVNANVSEEELPDNENIGLPAIAKALLGKPIRITNKRKEKYNDPTKQVNDISYTEASQAPNIAASELGRNIRGDVSNKNSSQSAQPTSRPSGDPFANNGAPMNITDDDLPF